MGHANPILPSTSTRTRQTSIPRPGSRQQNGPRSQLVTTNQNFTNDEPNDRGSPVKEDHLWSDSPEPNEYRENGSTTLGNGKTIRRVGSREGTLPLDEEDWNSRWIHRDKLAMIEIQEMQEAGIPIPFHKYLNQKSMRDSKASSLLQNQDTSSAPDQEWQKEHTGTPDDLVYSSQSQDEEEVAILPDPRTPEEIAADPYERGFLIPSAQAHSLRASSSRIPLSTSSPVPIPIEHIERSTPLPRKRGASGGPDDLLALNKTRRRSRSVGSTTVFDEGAGPAASPQARANRHSGNSITSPRLSSNQKTAGPGTPRNVSAHKRDVSSGQKPRTPSLPLKGSPSQRPATRSGLTTRPATAVNRPEGEAPWIATMFKPDPMLPPDQQLLPTYAKRLQQEQWEREGKSGSAFDRNFNPISIQQDRERPNLPQTQISTTKSEDEKGKEPPASWPLTSPQESNSPKTPSSEHAGYRTIPRVHSTPSIGPAQSPRIPAPRSQSNVQKPTEMAALKLEETKKERGCGCCIVM